MNYTLRHVHYTDQQLADLIYDPIVRRARLLGGGFGASQRALREAGASFGLIAAMAGVCKRTVQFRCIEDVARPSWHAQLVADAREALAAVFPGEVSA